MQPDVLTTPAPDAQQPYTYGDLLADLLALQVANPAALTQPARFISESGQGAVRDLWVLEENHINPSGEGLEPVSSYLPGEEEDFDPTRHMTEAELLSETTWFIGTAFLGIDLE